MVLPISRLRRWFALGAILMMATVAGMYFYARWSLRNAVHSIPAKIGLDIQQTAEGFSISKSIEGRTLFTVSASKAVQFKEGGRAELHNVKIVVYGKDASRFDRIAGDDFEYDPGSGNVSAKGTVLIDLEANPEGMRHSDQTPPEQTREPLHLETNGLIFNKNTGNASSAGKVVFRTPQASGSAVGVQYVAKTGTMNLLSAVVVTVNRPQPVRLNADHGLISKQPRQVFLTGVHVTREQQQMESGQATFFLREDNTLDHILAEGDVRSELHGRSETYARSDRAELFLTGTRNLLTTAILSGNVQLASQGAQDQGAQPAEAYAGRVTLHFAGQQMLETVHAEDGVRLSQKNSQNGAVAASPARLPSLTTTSAKGGGQDIEMTAPVMDFIVKNGRLRYSLRYQRPMIAIELQRGRLDYVRVLPQAGISGIHRNGRRAVGRHAAAGDVDRVGGGEHSAVRLRLQIGVRALDVTLGNGVAGRPVHANRLRRRGHAVVHHPRRSAQHQQLIGRCVPSPLRPSLLCAIGVGNTACLRDRRDAALWQKDDIKHLAGRYSIGLSRRASLTRVN